jgi:hypothetical protein
LRREPPSREFLRLKAALAAADSDSDSRLGLTAISQAWSFEKGRRTTPPFSLRKNRIP